MNADYGKFHTNRTNLVIHIVAVPLFVIGTLRAGWLLGTGHPFRSYFWLWVPFFALMLQAIGHRRERVPPERFRGVRDFLKRILAEQFYRFWVFVCSGGWFRNLRETWQ